MKLTEIQEVLSSRFSSEPADGQKRHIVFWYDAKGEFSDYVDTLSIPGVKIVRLKKGNAFATKRLLEVQDPESNYLVYSANPKPSPQENWLLDTLLYSSEFSADATLVLMHELGVADPGLRPVFEKYKQFFANQTRVDRFLSYGLEKHTEQSVEIAILSALCRQKVAGLEGVLQSVLSESLNDAENEVYKNICRFAGADVFWKHVRREYGYLFEDPSLRKLAIMLLVSALRHSSDAQFPESWDNYVSERRANCYIWVNNFMRHFSEAYDRLSGMVEDELDVKTHTQSLWSIDDFAESDIFRFFDQAIIVRIRDGLLAEVTEYDHWESIVTGRTLTYWYKEYRDLYSALLNAIGVLRFRSEHQSELCGSSNALFELYFKEYFRMDQYYRRFYAAYDRRADVDVLKPLRERVESVYTGWYLQQLGVIWSDAVAGELADNWIIPGAGQQTSFFGDFVRRRHLQKNERAFVIISDGLRYEIAEELKQMLSSVYPGITSIKAVQGVIPSYTSLGMAVLLPHGNVEIDDGDQVLVDGQRSKGTLDRQAILERTGHKCRAVTLTRLVDMTTDEMREEFRDVKVVYIYHNRIDATGEEAATERDVFTVVEKALEEICAAVGALRSKVSATHIYITADHGFIYTRDPLEEIDKISKSELEADCISRRYALSRKPSYVKGTVSVNMKYLLGRDYYAVVPRGYLRYRMQGAGQNYAHGGASLQEIVIPIVSYKSTRDERHQVGKVDLELKTRTRRITNMIFPLEFMQKEPVTARLQPRNLALYFVDEGGRRISSEARITVDSTSSDPNKRLYSPRFTLKPEKYDRSKPYYLIAEDLDELVDSVHMKVQFVIDIGIVDEFDF